MVRIAVVISSLFSGLTVGFIGMTDRAVQTLSPVEFCIGALAAFVFAFLVFTVLIIVPALLASESK